MKKRYILIILILAILLLVSYTLDKYTIKPVINENNPDFINVPQGFKVEIFYDHLGDSKISFPGPSSGVRMMLFNQDTVFAAVMKGGYIVALEDKNKNSKVENSKIFISNLKNPHSIDYYNGYYYIAEEDKIIRVRDENNDNIADLETVEKLLDLPSGAGHFTRTIKIINNKMYVSVGSSCNVCYETNYTRASIQECNLDGTNCSTFAHGLRNAVDFAYYDSQIYATENSRDRLNNDLPPDEINIIEKNKDYGWPLCYGDKIHDYDFDQSLYILNPCEKTQPSFVDLQAHSAPLGLAFYQGDKFPQEYKGKLFVAYHGSWNRDTPTGYKVVMIDTQTKEVSDFATGWLDESYNVKGRPVGITNFRDSLLISDDSTGKIYRIYYE